MISQTNKSHNTPHYNPSIVVDVHHHEGDKHVGRKKGREKVKAVKGNSLSTFSEVSRTSPAAIALAPTSPM